MFNGGDGRARVVGISLLLAAFSGSACQTTPHLVLSENARVLDLPVVRQDEMYACGLASVSALCAFWGRPLPEEASERLARWAREEKGLSGAELCTTLEGLGFETYLFEGEMGHGELGLMTQIDSRRPPLVMLSPHAGEHHYVLFMGYDDSRDAACLLDPVRGSVVESYEAFDKAWSACDRFTLIAVPAVLPSTPSIEIGLKSP